MILHGQNTSIKIGTSPSDLANAIAAEKAARIAADEGKVDKVEGKVLSSNDFTDEDKAELENKADKATTLEGYGIEDAYTQDDIDSELDSKIDKFTVMPEASYYYEGKIVQYVGNSTSSFTNGYFYKCVEDWSPNWIQPSLTFADGYYTKSGSAFSGYFIDELKEESGYKSATIDVGAFFEYVPKNKPIELKCKYISEDGAAGNIMCVDSNEQIMQSASVQYSPNWQTLQRTLYWEPGCTWYISSKIDINNPDDLPILRYKNYEYQWKQVDVQPQQDISGKVDKVTGKGLSTNDFTNAEKTKLAGIETDAEANVLEGVQVDGIDLPITGKKVNIDLSSKLSVTQADYDNIDDLKTNGVYVLSGGQLDTCYLFVNGNQLDGTYQTLIEGRFIKRRRYQYQTSEWTDWVFFVDGIDYATPGHAGIVKSNPTEGIGVNPDDGSLYINSTAESFKTAVRSVEPKINITNVINHNEITALGLLSQDTTITLPSITSPGAFFELQFVIGSTVPQLTFTGSYIGSLPETLLDNAVYSIYGQSGYISTVPGIGWQLSYKEISLS